MVAMLLAACTLALATFQEAPADKAKLAFDKAEELVRNGRYPEARAQYAKVAQEFADTAQGREAALRSKPSAYLGWADVVRHGPSKNRVDIALMADGYEMDNLKGFDKLAGDIPPLYERQETFREYYAYFNFVRAVMVSKENGVDGYGREYDTPLNAHTLGTFAGHVGIDRALVMEVLRRIEGSDGLAIVFVKNGVLGTGGSGVATIGGREVKTVIHEFGHAFAALGDEYQSAQSHAQGGAVGEAPNVSASNDPKSVPWSHWLEAKHPGVGMHEGASGHVKGAWRPTSTGCVMEDAQSFCIVCREQIVRCIYAIVDPIDACSPDPVRQGSPESLAFADDTFKFRVEVLQPSTHALDVSWYLLPETLFPKSGDGGSTTQASAGTAGPVNRARRGPLAPIQQAPTFVSRPDMKGAHTYTLTKKDLEPGRYRVVCRVKDSTKLRGEKWPWVLADPEGLLESERGWWISVPPKSG
jgi:hypothetical protein